MAEESREKITIKCGETITIDRDTPLPVDVTAEPVEESVEEPEDLENLIIPEDVIVVDPSKENRPQQYETYDPPVSPLHIRVVTASAVVEKPEDLTAAIMRMANQGQFPSGSKFVIAAKADTVDAERLGVLAEEAESAVRLSQDFAEGEISVDVRLFGPGSGLGRDLGTGPST